MTHCKKVIALRRARGGMMDGAGRGRGERRRRQRCRVDVLLKVKRGKGSEILREGRSYRVGCEVSRCDRKRRRSGVRRKMEDATLKLRWKHRPGYQSEASDCWQGLSCKWKENVCCSKLLYQSYLIRNSETEEIIIISLFISKSEITKSKHRTRKKQVSGDMLVWIRFIDPWISDDCGLWLESLHLSWINIFKATTFVVEKRPNN